MYTMKCEKCNGIMGVATIKSNVIVESKKSLSVSCPTCGTKYIYQKNGLIKKEKEGKK